MTEQAEGVLCLSPVTIVHSETVKERFELWCKFAGRNRPLENDLLTLSSELLQAHADCISVQNETTREALLRDTRIRCGWFGDQIGDMFTDQFAKSPNRRNLLMKLLLSNRQWFGLADSQLQSRETCNSPGVFAFFHRKLPRVKYVGADFESVFERVQTLLDDALSGKLKNADDAVFLVCLLCSNAAEWSFHFRPCERRQLQELMLTEVLEHDTLWPAGLNVSIPQTPECRHLLRTAIATKRWPPNAASSNLLASEADCRDCLSSNGQRLRITFTTLSAFQFGELFVQNDLRLYEASEPRLQKLFDLIQHLKSATTFAEPDKQVMIGIAKAYGELLGDKEEQLCASSRPRRRDSNELERIATVTNANHFKADLRHQSGWWAGHYRQPDTVVFSDANHLDLLTDVLVKKCLQTLYEQPTMSLMDLLKEVDQERAKKLIKAALHDPDGGAYWLVHKTLPAFRFVNYTRTRSILDAFRAFLSGVFNADHSYFAPSNDEPLGQTACSAAASLLVTRAAEWHFSFCPLPLAKQLRPDLLNVESLYNDVVLRLDSYWPHGFNTELLINENNLASFRRSCECNPLPPPCSI